MLNVYMMEKHRFTTQRRMVIIWCSLSQWKIFSKCLFILNSGHVQVTRFLIEHGADVKTENNQRNNPLHNAANRGNFPKFTYVKTTNKDFDVDLITS